MENEELEFEGKKYISSARAGMLVGYTKDYIGQLARAGKLEARLVGRSWYVSEDSIRKHKLGVHYVLTSPKKQRTDAQDKKDEKYNKNIVFSRFQDKNNYQNLREDGKNYVSKELKRTDGSYGAHALLHADIRYETGESISLEDDSYVPLLRSRKLTENIATSAKNNGAFLSGKNATSGAFVENVKESFSSDQNLVSRAFDNYSRAEGVDTVVPVCIQKKIDRTLTTSPHILLRPVYSAEKSRQRVTTYPHSQVRNAGVAMKHGHTLIQPRESSYSQENINKTKRSGGIVSDKDSRIGGLSQKRSKALPVIAGGMFFMFYLIWYVFF